MPEQGVSKSVARNAQVSCKANCWACERIKGGLAKLAFVHTLSEQMAFFDFRAYPKNTYDGDETKAAGRAIFNKILFKI